MVALISLTNLFYNLHRDEVADYDEARYGVSAYEMIKNGNYINNTYLGKKDYWNLKPPLGLWLIAASFKIFGFNVLGLKFPSAILSFLAVLLLVLIGKIWFNNLTGVLAGAIFLTLSFFLFYHGARSADFDAPLTFFILLSMFF